MIIKTSTGEHDDQAHYTAMELAKNYWWADHGYRAVTLTGRARYNKITLGKNNGVYLIRETTGKYGRMKRMVRNVPPETLLRLVKRDW